MPPLTEPNDLVDFCWSVERATDDELSHIVGKGLDATLAQTVLELAAMNELVSAAILRIMAHSGLRSALSKSPVH